MFAEKWDILVPFFKINTPSQCPDQCPDQDQNQDQNQDHKKIPSEIVRPVDDLFEPDEPVEHPRPTTIEPSAEGNSSFESMASNGEQNCTPWSFEVDSCDSFSTLQDGMFDLPYMSETNQEFLW
jgi:hypothetical protein